MQRAWHGWGRWFGALVAAAVPVAGLLQAAPTASSPPSEARPPQDKALRQLVVQLDADTLQLRQRASDELLAAGTDARSIHWWQQLPRLQVRKRRCAGWQF